MLRKFTLIPTQLIGSDDAAETEPKKELATQVDKILKQKAPADIQRRVVSGLVERDQIRRRQQKAKAVEIVEEHPPEKHKNEVKRIGQETQTIDVKEEAKDTLTPEEEEKKPFVDKKKGFDKIVDQWIELVPVSNKSAARKLATTGLAPFGFTLSGSVKLPGRIVKYGTVVCILIYF